MHKKEKNEYLFFDEDIEIEYNEDFESSKTKSLKKFPILNKYFEIDNSKIGSKSVKFNSRICFAPKIKFKQNNKKPSPLLFKRKANFHNISTQYDIINEDILSEKESSLNNDSSSSDSMEEEINPNINDANINENNKINENQKDSNKNEKLNSDIQYISKPETKNNIKFYEHKTIGEFNCLFSKGKKNKNSIKLFRNYLHKVKMNNALIKNKEQEFTINSKMNKLYRLDLINNSKKLDLNNEYTVIPIQKEENHDSDEDNNDISNLRGTISYIKSKQNKEKKNKSISIYEALRKSGK